MNHIFKTVFNKSSGTFVAVPEFAKGRVKTSGHARRPNGDGATTEGLGKVAKIAKLSFLSAVVMLLSGQAAFALPTGGVFTSGTGDITTSGSTMDITATGPGTGKDSAVGSTSNTAAVINWGSPGSGGFNIAQGETVNFIRNNQNISAWINIDQSGNVSSLNGTLNAVNYAGSAMHGDRPVILINPNGMTIGGSAVLDPDFVGIAGNYNATTGQVTLNNAPISVDSAYVIQNSGAANVPVAGGSSTEQVDVTVNTPDANGVSANSLPFSVGGAEVNLAANSSPTSVANLNVSNGSNTNLNIGSPLNGGAAAQINLNFPGLGGSGGANVGAIDFSDSNSGDTTTLVGGSSSDPVSISGGINNQNTYTGTISGDLSMTGDFAISNDASGNSGSNIQAGNVDLVGANITDSTTSGFSLQSNWATSVVSVDASSTINQTTTGGVSLSGGSVILDGAISSSGDSGNYASGVSISGDSVAVNGTINSLNASPGSVSGGVTINGGDISVAGTIHDDGVATDGSGTVGNGVAINNSGGYSNPNIDITGSVSSGASVNIDSYGNATIEQGASISGGAGVSIATDTNYGYSNGGLLSVDGSITTNTSSAGYANAFNANPNMIIGPGIALTGDNGNGGQSVNIGPDAVITNNGIGGVLVQDFSGNGDVSVSGAINNTGNGVDPVDAVLITGNNVDMNQASITTNGDTIDVQANTAITDIGSSLTSLNSASSSGSILETYCGDGCNTINVNVPNGINLMAGSDTFNATIGSSGANLHSPEFTPSTIDLNGTTINAVGTQDGGLTLGTVGLYADDGINAGQPFTDQYVSITGENNTIATAGVVDLEGTMTSTGAIGSGNGNTIVGATGVNIGTAMLQSQALVTGGAFAQIEGGQVNAGANGTVQTDGLGGVTIDGKGNPANVGAPAGYGGSVTFADGQTSSYGDGSVTIDGTVTSNSPDRGGIWVQADTQLTQDVGSTIQNLSMDASGHGDGVNLTGADVSLDGFVQNADTNNNLFIGGTNSVVIGADAHIQGVDGAISVKPDSTANNLSWNAGNKETSRDGVFLDPATSATGTPNSDNTVSTGTPSLTPSIEIAGSTTNVSGWLDAGQGAAIITQLFIDPVDGSSVYGAIPLFSYNLVDASGNVVAPANVGVTGSASYSGAPTSQSNVGTYSYSYNGGLSLTGTDASKYTIAGSSTPSTWEITPATLTIGGLSASNKVYDGNTSAVISGGALSGIVNGDTVGAVSTGTFATKNVGTGIDVSVNTTIAGAGSGNYVLSNPSNVVKADITPKPITEVAIADNKPYDGNTSAVVSSITSSGIIAGDDVTFGYKDANFNTPDVGNGKPVTVSGISASGRDAGNYLVTPTEVTEANITGSAASDPVVVKPEPTDVTSAVASDPAVVVPVSIQITTSNQNNSGKDSTNPAAISMSGNTVYVHTGSGAASSPVTVDSAPEVDSSESASVAAPSGESSGGSTNSIVIEPNQGGDSSGDSTGQNWIR